jgi:hypothetical protein
MGGVVWPHQAEAERQGLDGHWSNVEAYLPSMAHVVVMLLQFCNDQLKVGLPWMGIHLTPLITDRAVSPECKCRRGGPPYKLRVLRFWGAYRWHCGMHRVSVCKLC